MRRAVERLGVGMQVAVTGDAVLTQVGVGGLPSTLLVSSEGRLIGVASGARGRAFFDRQARALLGL